jgi:transcriptional regulator with XRE-family HTH domain
MNKVGLQIGFRIREQREALKYSREMFAEMAEISPDFLFDIETGKKNFTINVLRRICEALKISSDYFLFGNNNQVEQSIFLLNQMDEKQLMLPT